MEPEYEYRVTIDGISSPKGWGRNIYTISAYAIELREVNPHAKIVIEISPWYWYEEIKWHCPGCEYAACPSNW